MKKSLQIGAAFIAGAAIGITADRMLLDANNKVDVRFGEIRKEIDAYRA
jgi:hypothetical protein